MFGQEDCQMFPLYLSQGGFTVVLHSQEGNLIANFLGKKKDIIFLNNLFHCLFQFYQKKRIYFCPKSARANEVSLFTGVTLLMKWKEEVA